MSVTGRHLENIDLNRDGGVLVVSSNLTGQVWDGGLSYFPDCNDVESKLYQTHLAKPMFVSVADGSWCGNDRVVVATDYGNIEVLCLDGEFFVDPCIVLGHYSYTTSLSVTCDATHCVSGAADGFVNVGDLTENRLVKKYHTHSDVVNQVKTHNTSPDLFTSCSMDGTVLLFDTRKSTPAKKIALTSNIVTSVCYHGDKLAVGTETGQLLIKDLRATAGAPLKEAINHCRAIRKITSCPTRPNHIASCGEDGVVAVVNYDLLSTQSIYRSENHKDFVTGLVWRTGDELLSCSWDSTIKRHCVATSNPCHVTNGHMDS